MKRRDFIILTGAGATTAALLSACGHPENKLIPAFVPDDEYVPGLDYWKATACSMCNAGCGILVRTREHKANKIEGNPVHPANQGALCARGQAGLQVHYNPDRIRAPKKRIGERGSGQFADISWEEAIKTLVDRLREVKSGSGSIVLAAHNSDGITGLAAEHLAAALRTLRLADDKYAGHQVEAESYVESYGTRSQPVFDIAGSRYLLSFGARFLETWHSPVMYSLAFRRFRQPVTGSRGRFVHVEPRMSVTAANADDWLPAAPGTEGLVALAVAQVVTSQSLVPKPTAPSFLKEPLDNFSPERTSSLTGLPTQKVIRIAQDFARARGLAIGGGTASAGSNGVFNMLAINFLNSLVGNINRPGGVLLPSGSEFDPFFKWRGSTSPEWLSLPEQLDPAKGAPQAILVHRANPVFAAPWLADSIKAAPFIASFSPFMDETTILADLILPDNSNFEGWDLRANLSIPPPESASVRQATLESSLANRMEPGSDSAASAPRVITSVTLSRPVLTTENDTRQTADVLIDVGKQLGVETSRSLPFGSAEETVKAAAAELQKLRGRIPESTWQSKAGEGNQQPEASQPQESSQTGAAQPDADAGQFWNKFLEAGVWIAATANEGQASQPASSPTPKPSAGVLTATEPAQDLQYPLTLLAYEHPALGYGAEANLPWLQELPEPMTTVMWGSWIEINPKTAAAHSIEDGDLVEVRSPAGAVRAPALIYPPIHPDAVAMPYGQGHTAYGMYAEGRGANAAALSPLLVRQPGQSETIRVSISKVSGNASLIRFGTMLPERPESHR
ncbi:MAG TPA: molybdopterin-dependent oxidoreductase [Blastocatellia bacterium]|nr:molybdopterin-dependent oxidoreductase [Blastocatellia bacterium]